MMTHISNIVTNYTILENNLQYRTFWESLMIVEGVRVEEACDGRHIV